MSMSKQDFIALADAIRESNKLAEPYHVQKPFSPQAIALLANFCAAQNPRFNRERWLSYIAGECGSNGGAIKKTKAA